MCLLVLALKGSRRAPSARSRVRVTCTAPVPYGAGPAASPWARRGAPERRADAPGQARRAGPGLSSAGRAVPPASCLPASLPVSDSVAIFSRLQHLIVLPMKQPPSARNPDIFDPLSTACLTKAAAWVAGQKA